MSLAKAALALLIAAGYALAQNGAGPFSITGTVFDQSGASVPKAAVNLQRPAGNTVRSVETGLSGDFRFPAVAAGSYLIEVSHEGFKSTLTLVRASARLTTLSITLPVADVISEVTALQEPAQVSTDISENHDAAAVDQSLFDKLPVFDQDYVSRMAAFLDAGATGTAGTSLVVDGMEANNAGVTASAIKEVRINQNPYSAEFARPGRGRIEIITKDAGAAYHGTFNFTFRDWRLNARDPFALVRAPEQRRIFEGSLTGPVGHSKTTAFLFSGSRQDDDLQAIVYARGPAGPIQETVASPRGLTQVSFRISHQWNPNHTMFWQFNDREYPGHNLGVGGFVLPESGVNPDHWERELIFNDRLALSTQWVNQFQILVGREHEALHSVSSAPGIVVQGAFTGGGAQVDLLRTENHVQWNDIASWSVGKHLLKLGVNVPDWSRRGVDDFNNFGGTFYFSTLADYAAAHPYAFQIQQGLGHVVYWQKELGWFVQDEFKLRPDLSLALGMRYDWQNYLHDDNNLSPRLAFAYAPHRSKTTVLRGGGGIFYDRTGAVPLSDLVLYNGLRLRNYLITDPTYPSPLLEGGFSGQPPERVRLDPAVREPYTLQYSFAVERQVRKRTTVSATYRGSRGVKLFRSRDLNAPLPPDYVARPDAGVGILRNIESSGRQAGDALDLTLQGEVTQYFTGLMQYTLSRTRNNTGGIAWFPANQYDLAGEWSRADFDQRHRFNLLGSVNTGKRMSLGMGLTLNSGGAYTMTTGTDPYHTGMTNARPAGVARNTLEGPGYADVDLRWSRDFFWNKEKKDKGAVTTLAFDAFNVMNHVNYAGYVGNLSSPFFGQAVTALPTRRLQVTARFKF